MNNWVRVLNAADVAELARATAPDDLVGPQPLRGVLLSPLPLLL